MKALKGTSMVALVVALLFTPYMAVAQCYTIGCRAFSQSTPAPTWAYVDTAFNAACSSASASCTVTGLTPTTAGSVLVAFLGSAANGVTSIASASGGGGTWNLCASSGCYVSNLSGSTLDAAYNITGTGGATSVTVTLGSVAGVSWVAVVDEFTCTANCGTNSLDALGAVSDSTTNCTSCTGSSFTGITAGDLCVSGAFPGGTLSAVSSPYTFDSVGEAYSLNTPRGTAPTWTQTSGHFSANGMCFK
jgi:hypothetical protein